MDDTNGNGAASAPMDSAAALDLFSIAGSLNSTLVWAGARR